MEKARYLDTVTEVVEDEYHNKTYVSTSYFTNGEVLPGAIPHDEGYTGHEQKFIVKSTYPINRVLFVKGI